MFNGVQLALRRIYVLNIEPHSNKISPTIIPFYLFNANLPPLPGLPPLPLPPIRPLQKAVVEDGLHPPRLHVCVCVCMCVHVCACAFVCVHASEAAADWFARTLGG